MIASGAALQGRGISLKSLQGVAKGHDARRATIFRAEEQKKRRRESRVLSAMAIARHVDQKTIMISFFTVAASLPFLVGGIVITTWGYVPGTTKDTTIPDDQQPAELKAYPMELRVLSFVGPIVMATAVFIMIIACVTLAREYTHEESLLEARKRRHGPKKIVGFQLEAKSSPITRRNTAFEPRKPTVPSKKHRQSLPAEILYANHRYFETFECDPGDIRVETSPSISNNGSRQQDWIEMQSDSIVTFNNSTSSSIKSDD